MDVLTSIFRSGDALCTRSVSPVVRTVVLDVPIPPARLLADWQREISAQLGLDAGDIEALPLGRTRLRWPQLGRCFDAVQHWMLALGMPEVLGASDVALMASRGTPYHHDGARYGGMAFCNVFLSEDCGADLHFPAAGQRIALVRGTAVVFDPCQPHAIVKRGAPGFDAADFACATMRPQVFLTWELPIERDELQRALGITVHGACGKASPAQGVGVCRNGAPATVCPRTGRWLSPASAGP